MITLSPEQSAVRTDILSGRNVLVSGQAGTGKSTLLREIQEAYGPRLSLTASTGIAALNVGGSTINSFAGLIKGEEPADVIADRVIGAKRRHFWNIKKCRVLAIDEISMLSGQLLDKIDRLFQRVKENSLPFGGVQLVFFGDFLQLPPVSRDPTNPATFAFESAAWANADILVHSLTKVFRQNDQVLVDALSGVRVGETSGPGWDMLVGRNQAEIPDDGIRPIIVHTHNASVDEINLEALYEIPGKERCYDSIDKGEPAHAARLDRDCLAPKELRLKEGAQVMLLANLDAACGLANGSMGTVTQLGEDTIEVQFGRLGSIPLHHHTWQVTSGDAVLAERSQFPLRLAYAITAHKTQGLTLDRIQCHLGRTFECGQAYVALSRVKTLEGLFVRDFTANSVRVHPRALAFYREAEVRRGKNAHLEFWGSI